MFTKETTKHEINCFLATLGKDARFVEFLMQELCTGENRVMGKVAFYNEIANLVFQGRMGEIKVQAYELGYNG